MTDSQPKRRRWFTPGIGATQWLWLSAFVIGLDQWTKWLTVKHLDLYDRIYLLPFLDLTHRRNTGAAFSFLADAGGWQRWFFVTLALVVSVVIMFWLRSTPARGHLRQAMGLALILGGALGNVIDRALHGYVVDFILVHYNDWYFPAFNVADSAITLGAGLLILDALWEGRSDGIEKNS